MASLSINSSEDSEDRIIRPRLDSFSSSSSSYGSLRLSTRSPSFSQARTARSRRKRAVAPGVPSSSARKRRLATNLSRTTSSAATLPSIKSTPGVQGTENSSGLNPVVSEVVETTSNDPNTTQQDKIARTVRRKKSDKLKLETTRALSAPAAENPVTLNATSAKPIKTKKKDASPVPKDVAAARTPKVPKVSSTSTTSMASTSPTEPMLTKAKVVAPKKRRSMKDMNAPTVQSPASQIPQPLPSFVSSQGQIVPQISTQSAIVTSSTPQISASPKTPTDPPFSPNVVPEADTTVQTNVPVLKKPTSPTKSATKPAKRVTPSSKSSSATSLDSSLSASTSTSTSSAAPRKLFLTPPISDTTEQTPFSPLVVPSALPSTVAPSNLSSTSQPSSEASPAAATTGGTTIAKKVVKKKKVKKNFLHSMPLELLINTLSYLDPLSLTRVIRCSKMLRQIGSENIIWRDICCRPGFLKAGQKKPRNVSWGDYFKMIYAYRHLSRFNTYMHDKIRFIIGHDPEQLYEFHSQLSHSAHGIVLAGIHLPTKEMSCLARVEFEDAMLGPFKENHATFKWLEAVESPHLVPQYGTFFDGSSLWYINEFCEGGSARMQIDSGGGVFTEHEAAAICYAVLSSLELYHARNKSHGAISASSIMISTYDKMRCKPKLRDKTFASLVSEWRLGPVASQSRRMYWRAPEQQRTPAMDIWSLGITCLELVEGRPPHWNLPPAKARQQVISQPAPSLLHPNRWTDNFRRFIEQCLIKDPQRRPTPSMLLKHPFVTENIRCPSDSLLFRQPLKWPKSETPLLLTPPSLNEPPAAPNAIGVLQRSNSRSSSVTTYYTDEEENISFASLSTSHVSLADSYSDDFTDHSYNSLSHSDFY